MPFGKTYPARCHRMEGRILKPSSTPCCRFPGQTSLFDAPGRRWPNSANYGAIAYRIVNAQYWGVPQRRRRIYLVADFDGESAGDVVFERKGTPWYLEPSIPAGKTVAALAKESVALGFMAGQSADAGSTGAEIELSPTLRSSSSGTNQAPTVVALMGNVIDRQAGQGYTLDTISRHGVACKN